jgi:hypothetical protein
MRPALETAQNEAWRRLGLPGTWWTGQERQAIAQECRAATGCAFCATRAAALSPLTVAGRHDVAEPSLPPAAIEAIHRIRTDPGRLGGVHAAPFGNGQKLGVACILRRQDEPNFV